MSDTARVTIGDCKGVYVPRVYSETAPRVAIFGGECGCLVMDIFSQSCNEISYDVTLELIRMHDTIISIAAEYDSPMISAMHAMVASHHGSHLINRAVRRKYLAFRQQIETVILSATCVTLLDLSEYMPQSLWLKRTVKFMDLHSIDYVPFTPEGLCVNVTETSYPTISSMRKTSAR